MYTHSCMCSHPFCLLTYSPSPEEAVRCFSFSSQGLSFQLQTLPHKFWGSIYLSAKSRSNKAQVQLGTSLCCSQKCCKSTDFRNCLPNCILLLCTHTVPLESQHGDYICAVWPNLLLNWTVSLQKLEAIMKSQDSIFHLVTLSYHLTSLPEWANSVKKILFNITYIMMHDILFV